MSQAALQLDAGEPKLVLRGVDVRSYRHCHDEDMLRGRSNDEPR